VTQQFDKFELRVNPENYVNWGQSDYSDPAGVLNLMSKMQGEKPGFKKLENGFQPIDIYINDKPLIEIIREIEEVALVKENLKRDQNSQLIPGDYLSLPASSTYLPSRNLLDKPKESGFVIEPDDLHYGKSTLLGCTCGVTECWFIVAKIWLTPTTVTWSNFAQFHLDYEYQLKPFIFERKEYEKQLLPIKK
jgi:hypothetical protein